MRQGVCGSGGHRGTEGWGLLPSYVFSCCATMHIIIPELLPGKNVMVSFTAHLVIVQVLLRFPGRLRISQASPLGQVQLPMQGGLLCNHPLHQQAVWVNAIHQLTKLIVAAVMAPLDEVAQQLGLQLQDSGLWQPFGLPEGLLCTKL